MSSRTDDDHEPAAPAFLGSTSSLSRQRLRARRYTRVSRDVYLLSDGAADLRRRCAGLLLAVPDAVVSHATAADLHGLPVRRDPLLHLTRPSGAAPVRRVGVVPHVRLLSPQEVVLVDGVRTTSLTRTFHDLAPRLPVQDLVAVGDVVARRVGLVELQQCIERARGLRALVRARQALALVDPGADSPPETRVRLLLHDAGYTRLAHQVTVRDSCGTWVSRPDLADEEARVAVQYDGLVHLLGGAEQWRSDIDRDERTRAAGWEVVVLTARDLRRPALLLSKVSAAYARAAARRG